MWVRLPSGAFVNIDQIVYVPPLYHPDNEPWRDRLDLIVHGAAHDQDAGIVTTAAITLVDEDALAMRRWLQEARPTAITLHKNDQLDLEERRAAHRLAEAQQTGTLPEESAF